MYKGVVWEGSRRSFSISSPLVSPSRPPPLSPLLHGQSSPKLKTHPFTPKPSQPPTKISPSTHWKVRFEFVSFRKVLICLDQKVGGARVLDSFIGSLINIEVGEFLSFLIV